MIAQNYTTIQLLRRRLADMEKHKFVLGYRTQVCPFSPAAGCLSHLHLLSSFLRGAFCLPLATGYRPATASCVVV